jgi:hypothetical protein
MLIMCLFFPEVIALTRCIRQQTRVVLKMRKYAQLTRLPSIAVMRGEYITHMGYSNHPIWGIVWASRK